MIGGVKTVAICVSELHNEDIQEMVYPLCRYLKQEGYACMLFASCTQLFSSNPFDRGEVQVFSYIPYDKVDVVFIFSHVINDKAIVKNIIRRCNERHVPVIAYNLEEHLDGAINIVFNEGNAFSDLVTHVVEDHGAKRIKCIAGIDGTYVNDMRMKVFRDVLKAHDIPFDEEKDLGYGMFYEQPTQKVMKRFLEDPDGLPDAIICFNDCMAIEACRILRERGVNVPEDVIVTGFDGTVQERYSLPRLCTCKRDMYGMARAVAKNIIHPDGTHSDNGMVRIPYIFTPSTSCGCQQSQKINDIVNVTDLFMKNYYINKRDSDMTYMGSKLTVISRPEDLRRYLEIYTNCDTYICTYQGSDVGENIGIDRQIEREDRVMECRFFPEEEQAESIYLGTCTEGTYISEIEKRISAQDLLIFFALHGEDSVTGYIAMVVDDSNVMHFGSSVTMDQKFVSGLDTAVAMHLMQMELRQSNDFLYHIQNKIISGFSELVESRDDFTGQHIKRTSEYIKVLCDHMADNEKYRTFLTEYMIDLIYKAAPLHDVGKIKISDVILNKPGRLTMEEFDCIKAHTTEGYNIIRTLMSEVEDEDYIELAQDVALYHHEKWDGSGYPVGLKGEEIPLPARLMAIVDVFDALSSKRVYKDAYSLDETFRIIEESSGSHFDPEVVKAFLEVRDEIEKTFQRLTL